MAGTIRCKHGHVMYWKRCNVSFAALNSEQCEECYTLIPVEVYNSIQEGCNFTHVFFPSQKDAQKYLEENKEKFQFIGHNGSTLPDGQYHLVY